MTPRASSPTRAEAIDRALKVVRKRIDEFGVSEPVVQKVGNDRIIVDIPGVDDRERASKIVQDSGLPRVPDHRQDAGAREGAPASRCDRARDGLRRPVASDAGATTPSASAPLGGLLTTGTDTIAKGAAAAKRTARRRTARRRRHRCPRRGGPFSKLISAGQMPGEYRGRAQTTTMRSELSSIARKCRRRAAAGQGGPLGQATRPSIGNKVVPQPLRRRRRPIITGEYLTDAKPNTEPARGRTVVEFTLNNEGGRRFRAETAKHVQRLHGDRARRHA